MRSNTKIARASLSHSRWFSCSLVFFHLCWYLSYLYLFNNAPELTMIIRMDEIWIGKIGTLKCVQKFLCSLSTNAQSRAPRIQTMLIRAMLARVIAIMMFCRCCCFCCVFSFFLSFFISVNYATICFAKISKHLYAIQLDNLSVYLFKSIARSLCVFVHVCANIRFSWGKTLSLILPLSRDFLVGCYFWCLFVVSQFYFVEKKKNKKRRKFAIDEWRPIIWMSVWGKRASCCYFYLLSQVFYIWVLLFVFVRKNKNRLNNNNNLHLVHI